eukprot:TRINITY_DN1681_c0_g3_i1.p1 TRINITY_DN1681_c0_g3~~TRINITY_DN1681_c0_g3_i1.p1  ORF type:complete len:257 (+),score=26.31 TRINITY_DN1681_c0_g3_i1:154-924(+)
MGSQGSQQINDSSMHTFECYRTGSSVKPAFFHQNSLVEFKQVVISSTHSSKDLILNQEESKKVLISRRNSTDDCFHLLHSSVSVLHAYLRWSHNRGTLVLRDLGSVSGTFIKISEIFIQEGFIFEIGSIQLGVTRIAGNNRALVLTIMELRGNIGFSDMKVGSSFVLDLSKRGTITVGKAIFCDLCLKDEGLNEIHAVFELDGGIKLKAAGTSKIWWRLSPTKTESREIMINVSDLGAVGSQEIKFGECETLISLL